MPSKGASTPELEDECGVGMPCPECEIVNGCKKAKACQHPQACRCYGPACDRCAADIEAAYWRCVRQRDMFTEERDAN